MILISIPYIEKGEYQIKNKNTSICNIIIGEMNGNDDINNVQISNYIMFILLPFLIITFLSFILLRKKKND